MDLADFCASAPRSNARFHPVGRLDRTAAACCSGPTTATWPRHSCDRSSGVWKTYEVQLAAPLQERRRGRLATGRIELDGRPVRECRMHADPDGDRRHWLMELHEGRNRQIRRMFAAVDGHVAALVRIAFGPVTAGPTARRAISAD